MTGRVIFSSNRPLNTLPPRFSGSGGNPAHRPSRSPITYAITSRLTLTVSQALQKFFDALNRSASRQIATGPCPLEIESANPSVHIEDFTAEVEVGNET